MDWVVWNFSDNKDQHISIGSSCLFEILLLDLGDHGTDITSDLCEVCKDISSACGYELEWVVEDLSPFSDSLNFILRISTFSKFLWESIHNVFRLFNSFNNARDIHLLEVSHDRHHISSNLASCLYAILKCCHVIYMEESSDHSYGEFLCLLNRDGHYDK